MLQVGGGVRGCLDLVTLIGGGASILVKMQRKLVCIQYTEMS